MMAGVREHDPVLQMRPGARADRFDASGRGDHEVRVLDRTRERRHAMAVHVRSERLDRIDLDDRHLAAEPFGALREPLADPAVADDAEPLAGRAQVRQAEDRRQGRLAGAVRIVEHVLAARVVRGDRRKREAAGGL